MFKSVEDKTLFYRLARLIVTAENYEGKRLPKVIMEGDEYRLVIAPIHNPVLCCLKRYSDKTVHPMDNPFRDNITALISLYKDSKEHFPAFSDLEVRGEIAEFIEDYFL